MSGCFQIHFISNPNDVFIAERLPFHSSVVEHLVFGVYFKKVGDLLSLSYDAQSIAAPVCLRIFVVHHA